MKIFSLIPVLITIVLTLASCHPAQVDGETQPVPEKSLKIIPWVEDNYAKYDAHVMEGLEIWKNVSDTAIVSTMPGRSKLFARLHRVIPEMRIIPGLKTMNLLQRFDSVQGWENVAQEIRAIQSVTGQKMILLENEVAMKSYVDGKYTLNFENLRKGLSKLPVDMKYFWYPSIWGNKIKRNLNEKVCRIVEEVLSDVRFLDQRFQGHNAVTSNARRNADGMLHKFIKKKTLPMLYFYGPDHPVTFWRDDQLQQALGHVRNQWGDDAEVVLYPGVKRWVQAARSLSNQLPPKRDRISP